MSATMTQHMLRPKNLWYVFAIFLIGSLLFVLHVLHSSPLVSQYQIVRDHTAAQPLPASNTKHILLWTGFFHSARWGLPEDTLSVSHFQHEFRCPVYNCELSNQHDFLPSVDMYDAIVFHAAEAFPLLHSIPLKRSPRQFYVFALMEPPGETKHDLSNEGGFYNLTMTYRLDSDIVWPYSQIIDRQSNSVVAPARHPKWLPYTRHSNNSQLMKIWSAKTKMAAWFVSHCKTMSKREQLVEALQQHIEVDVFGKCGTKSCERYSTVCDKMLEQHYKFYLSFENSLCTDYVSEKLYNAFKLNIIPVVFGGANYSQFLPPHSYIDVERFQSVEQLASYLKHLAETPKEYLSYFWWRKHYRLGYESPFCKLCEILHTKSYQLRSQSYNNIEEWWLGNSCRFESKIQY